MKCKTVSPGWYCGGEDGHDGPCAAWPPCYVCGYLGPELMSFFDIHSICHTCSQNITPGDLMGAHGDQMWDGSLWDRMKYWIVMKLWKL